MEAFLWVNKSSVFSRSWKNIYTCRSRKWPIYVSQIQMQTAAIIGDLCLWCWGGGSVKQCGKLLQIPHLLKAVLPALSQNWSRRWAGADDAEGNALGRILQQNVSIFWQQLLMYYKEHIVKLFRLQLLTCPLKFLCNKEEISLAQLQHYSFLPGFK